MVEGFKAKEGTWEKVTIDDAKCPDCGAPMCVVPIITDKTTGAVFGNCNVCHQTYVFKPRESLSDLFDELGI